MSKEFIPLSNEIGPATVPEVAVQAVPESAPKRWRRMAAAVTAMGALAGVLGNPGSVEAQETSFQETAAEEAFPGCAANTLYEPEIVRDPLEVQAESISLAAEKMPANGYEAIYVSPSDRWTEHRQDYIMNYREHIDGMDRTFVALHLTDDFEENKVLLDRFIDSVLPMTDTSGDREVGIYMDDTVEWPIEERLYVFNTFGTKHPNAIGHLGTFLYSTAFYSYTPPRGDMPHGDVPISEQITRYAGATRLETAVEISRGQFSDRSAESVVLVNRDAGADAIVAGTLARYLGADGEANVDRPCPGAPVLLVEKDRVPSATLAEIHRVLKDGGRITLVGGEAVISESVRQQLIELGYDEASIERLAGQTRFETSLRVAERFEQNGPSEFEYGQLPEGYVAVDGNNESQQIALLAGDLATRVEAPLILLNGTLEQDQMVDSMLDFLRQRGYNLASEEFPYPQGYVLSEPVIDAFSGYYNDNYPATEPFRFQIINGSEPTAVSLFAARYNEPHTTTRNDFVVPQPSPDAFGIVASGRHADALSGTPVEGPLLYVHDPETMAATGQVLPPEVEERLREELRLNPALPIAIFGGEAAVAQPVQDRIQAIIEEVNSSTTTVE